MAETRTLRLMVTGAILAATTTLSPLVALAGTTPDQPVLTTAAIDAGLAEGKIIARRGADDPAGDTRNGRGKDDGANHT